MRKRLAVYAMCLLLPMSGAVMSGCQSASQHAAEVQKAQQADEKITVGTVQREIRVGMSGGDVVSVLGAPNVVTTDENRNEVWIWDKISTNSVYSTSSSGVLALIFADVSSGAASTSQRTLTVIVKFDDQKKVRDFAYHQASF